MEEEKKNSKRDDDFYEEEIGILKVPEHLVIEIFIRAKVSDWVAISCVKKHWASVFRSECFWQAAFAHKYPLGNPAMTWPGPIPPPTPPGSTKRRFMAIYISDLLFYSSYNMHLDEIAGHCYLFLKEQLQLSVMPPHSGILHGTMIDQFLACGKTRNMADEIASQIWLTVLNNLEENQHTFSLLKRLAHEGDVFLPYPYTKSVKVQWRVFEKLFTDFRDCFSHVDYYDMVACAKSRFQPIPSSWLGY